MRTKFTVNAVTNKAIAFELVEYWNSLPGSAPRCKRKDPLTATHKLVLGFIEAMLMGNFGKYSTQLDLRWVNKHHEVSKWLSKKSHSPEEVKGMFYRASLIYRNGYWPPSKNDLPSSLAGLIYNPMGRTSLFLLAALKFEQGKTLDPFAKTYSRMSNSRDVSTQRLVSMFDTLEEYIVQARKIPLQLSEKSNLLELMHPIREAYFDLHDGDNTGRIAYHLPDEIVFAEDYGKFIASAYGNLKSLSTVAVKPHTKVWDRYVSDVLHDKYKAAV